MGSNIQKIGAIFAIWFAFTALSVAAQVGTPAPAPSHAPAGLASVQSTVVGVVGVAISFFFLKQVA